AIICVSEATEFKTRIRRPDVTIHELKKRPGKDLGAYQRMWKILRELKPRIVHTRNLPALDMIAPAYLAAVPRFVHSEHGFTMLEIDGKNPKSNRLRRLSRLVVDRYVALSRDIHDWLRDEIRVSEQRLVTIYNGVDTDRFTPENAQRAMMPTSFSEPGAIVIGT